ncbi:hypothetical protein K491DRAFT_702415 [Lophiostoma macrostomum CBS 122681]|uniref:Uncharacterized protein n=1 Tax=Lophiostoma macrostomum CBS 122681 TaxID=1314788 RepID=A0A6A6TIA0_9PLEO|nr:hypothetical protein K491DRAFT_702415 [Lophiostoma macrostomum CBS 122681]
MGEKWKYYDVEDYKSWKRKQGKEYRSPPRENYLAAAIYIRNLFDGKKFNWAAVGSLAMLCLGSRREMSDIHIVYDDQDYKRIKSKLESDDRVRLPKGINSLFPIKILIKTGPHFKDSGCTTTADVELDLLPPGRL